MGVLIGLGLNAMFGWWWADPAAALIVAGFAGRSGWTMWHEASDAAD
jgi:divalent metal cation (Fe/Co/Zn/Cd) transporter